MTSTHSIVIRHATDADAVVLGDLASLDSRRPLAGPALIAEVEGTARAAIDLSDGSVAADPFAPTAQLVELLRVRASALAAEDTPLPLRARLASFVRRPRLAGAGNC